MSAQHGNRHRRFEPPHDMEPGAPETLKALDEARVTGLARMAWAQRPQVFQVDPAWRPPEWVHLGPVLKAEGELLAFARSFSKTLRGPTPNSAEWWRPAR